MEFITQNYIWFILGGIIILMTIIGYIAERTDFGRKELEKRSKEPKPKKEKKQKGKKEKAVEEVVKAPAAPEVTDVPVDAVVPVEEDLNMPIEDVPMGGVTPVEPVEPVGMNAEDAFNQPIVIPDNNAEDLYKPLDTTVAVDNVVPVEEDLNVPIGDVPMSGVTPIEPVEPVMTDVSVENPVMEAVTPEPMDVMPEVAPIETPEAVTPPIDNAVPTNSGDDEDIWKF